MRRTRTTEQLHDPTGRRGARLAVIVALPVVLLGCTDTTSTDDLTAADAVECRELGGGWTFTRLEGGSSSSVGVTPRLPTDPEAADVEAMGDADLATATRERVANGWDDRAIQQLLLEDPPPQVLARLRTMPSCLDELRGQAGDDAG